MKRPFDIPEDKACWKCKHWQLRAPEMVIGFCLKLNLMSPKDASCNTKFERKVKER